MHIVTQVAPEVSAEAQASYGGGWQTPSSAEHLYKLSKLPKETPYGVEGRLLLEKLL